MPVYLVTKHTNDYEFVRESLREGKAVILQTDTVMGIMSLNKDLLYEIKNRPLKKKSYYS